MAWHSIFSRYTLSPTLLWFFFFWASTLGSSSTNTFAHAQQLTVISNTTITPANQGNQYKVISAKLDQKTNKIYALLSQESNPTPVLILKIDSLSQTVEGQMEINDKLVSRGREIVLYDSTLAYVWLVSPGPGYDTLLGQVDLKAFQLSNLYNISGLVSAFKDSQAKLNPNLNLGRLVPADQSLVVPVYRQQQEGKMIQGLIKFSLFPQFQPVDLLLPFPFSQQRGFFWQQHILGFPDSTRVFLPTREDVIVFDVKTMQVLGPVDFPREFLGSSVWNIVPGTHDVLLFTAYGSVPPVYKIMRWHTNSNKTEIWGPWSYPFGVEMTMCEANSDWFSYTASSFAGHSEKIVLLYRSGLAGFPNSTAAEYIELDGSWELGSLLMMPAVGGNFFTMQNGISSEPGAVFLLKIGSRLGGK